MRNPIAGAQFRRDARLAQKRGNDMAKLHDAILLLIEGRKNGAFRAVVVQ